MNEELFYRRRLPHLQPPRSTFFVSSRLVGSLPDHAIVELKEEQAFLHKQFRDAKDEKTRNHIARKLDGRYFGKFDEYVDHISTGPKWLATPNIAAMVAEAIHFRDVSIYDLLCYTIMPNHIHLVFSVQRNDISLYRIMQSLKRHTAREANKLLGRQGAFWHHESYDHVVKDGAELERTLQYVLLNPVKAHLCKHWDDWKWSYIRNDLRILD